MFSVFGFSSFRFSPQADVWGRVVNPFEGEDERRGSRRQIGQQTTRFFSFSFSGECLISFSVEATVDGQIPCFVVVVENLDSYGVSPKMFLRLKLLQRKQQLRSIFQKPPKPNVFSWLLVWGRNFSGKTRGNKVGVWGWGLGRWRSMEMLEITRWLKMEPWQPWMRQKTMLRQQVERNLSDCFGVFERLTSQLKDLRTGCWLGWFVLLIQTCA